MDKLNDDLIFSAWKDGNRKACSMHVRGTIISFYMSEEEFTNFALGKADSFADIRHNLRVYGDYCTFFDLEFPTKETQGMVSVPYLNVNIPFFARRILLRWAKKQWNADVDYHRERPEIKVSKARMSKWTRLYGCGTGKAHLEMDDGTRRFLELCFSYESKFKTSNKEESLKQSIDRLMVIAQNNTYSFLETATVGLAKDWDGFFFNILSPKKDKNGRRYSVLHGGIINHGKAGEQPSWATHT